MIDLSMFSSAYIGFTASCCCFLSQFQSEKKKSTFIITGMYILYIEHNTIQGASIYIFNNIYKTKQNWYSISRRMNRINVKMCLFMLRVERYAQCCSFFWSKQDIFVFVFRDIVTKKKKNKRT